MRLINEDAVMEIIERVTNEAVEKNQRKYLIQPRIIAEIAGLPTIEAEPVKHGRWEVNGDRFYPFCSNCKYEPPKELIRCNALNLEPILTKYCPNCGSENGTRIYRGGENNG